MEFYKQCTLQSGNTRTTGWIEERGAKLGFNVTLEDSPGQWWKVIEVGTMRLSKDMVHARERDYLNQRKASDIKSGSRERF